MIESVNREAFVRFAVLTDNADLAYFRQRQAQMYAAFHSRVSRIAAFVPIGQLAAARPADGSLVFVAPLDHLVWTRSSGLFVAQVSDYVDQNVKPRRPSSSGSPAAPAIWPAPTSRSGVGS